MSQTGIPSPTQKNTKNNATIIEIYKKSEFVHVFVGKVTRNGHLSERHLNLSRRVMQLLMSGRAFSHLFVHVQFHRGTTHLSCHTSDHTPSSYLSLRMLVIVRTSSTRGERLGTRAGTCTAENEP